MIRHLPRWPAIVAASPPASRDRCRAGHGPAAAEYPIEVHLLADAREAGVITLSFEGRISTPPMTVVATGDSSMQGIDRVISIGASDPSPPPRSTRRSSARLPRYAASPSCAPTRSPPPEGHREVVSYRGPDVRIFRPDGVHLTITRTAIAAGLAADVLHER